MRGAGGVGVGVTVTTGGGEGAVVGGGAMGATVGAAGVGTFGSAAARTSNFAFGFGVEIGVGVGVAIKVRRGVTRKVPVDGGVEGIGVAFVDGVFRGAGALFFACGFGDAEPGDAVDDGARAGPALAQ